MNILADISTQVVCGSGSILEIRVKNLQSLMCLLFCHCSNSTSKLDFTKYEQNNCQGTGESVLEQMIAFYLLCGVVSQNVFKIR